MSRYIFWSNGQRHDDGLDGYSKTDGTVAWICRFEWADQDLDAGADTRVGEGDELR